MNRRVYLFCKETDIKKLFKIRLIVYNIIIPIIFLRSLLYKLYSKFILKNPIHQTL